MTVLQQWSTGEAMQYLRQVGFHSRTLAGGHDHDVECHE
jgi:hypothetical protein